MALKIGRRLAVVLHNALRKFFSFSDYLLWAFFDPEAKKKIKTGEIKKILILLINQEKGNVGGDFITLGVLNAFKKSNPQIEVFLLSDEQTLQNIGNLKSIKTLKYGKNFKTDSIKRGGFDAVIFMNPGNLKISSFSFIPYKIGFTTLSVRGFFGRQERLGYTRKIYNKISEHMVDLRFRMFEALGFKFSEKKPFLEFSKQERTKVSSFLKSNKIKKFIIIHPGGKYVAESFSKGNWAPHLWNPERYAEVADHFTSKGYSVIITGSAYEGILADEIKKYSKNKVINACGKLSIRETGALLEKAACLISTDTSIVHLAYQVGTPIVELMGPSIPEAVGAWPLASDKNIILVDKGPAYRSMRKLPFRDNLNCLKNIKTSEVIKAAEKLMRRHPVRY